MKHRKPTAATGRARAFVLLDTVGAIVILGVLALAFATAGGRQQIASERLADSRAAAREAEAALVDLQRGHKPTAMRVTVRRAAGGQAPAGYAWVDVTATVGPESSRLTGLARVEAITP